MNAQPICPTCGQALPSDRVEEAREKTLAAFNLRKAQRLTEIETDGRALSADIERLKSETVKLHEARLSAAGPTSVNIEALTTERDALKAMAEDYKSIPGYISLVADRAALEDAIRAEKEGKTEERDDIRERVTELEGQLTAAKAEADKFVRREQGEQRTEELKAEEKKLVSEFERLAEELYLTEQFVRTKINLLTDRINSKFHTIKWKLFEVQINQALNECCTATVNGIPYDSGLNSAGRTNAGLDIIKALQSYYGLQVPVFVDNAESVVDLLPMDCQVIRLIVSELDPVLRVVTRAKKEVSNTLFK